jgi:hypothetical protein
VTIVVGDHTITLKDVVAGSVPLHDAHGEGMLVARVQIGHRAAPSGRLP